MVNIYWTFCYIKFKYRHFNRCICALDLEIYRQILTVGLILVWSIHNTVFILYHRYCESAHALHTNYSWPESIQLLKYHNHKASEKWYVKPEMLCYQVHLYCLRCIKCIITVMGSDKLITFSLWNYMNGCSKYCVFFCIFVHATHLKMLHLNLY